MRETLESILLESIIGHATPVELAWTAFGLTGIAFGLINVVEAWRNKDALGKRTNGRRVLANRAVRRESIKGVIFSLSILLGVLASFTPSPPVRSETSLYGSVILIVILALLVLDSILDRKDDKYLMTHGLTSRDHREMTQDETEDLKFGTERRALESEHIKDNEGD